MENNKLIAEFMGYDISTIASSGVEVVEFESKDTKVDNLKYHTSWDWLMPVHRKCIFTPNFSGDDQLRTLLIDAVIDADINRLYDAVVEFIKEYKDEG